MSNPFERLFIFEMANNHQGSVEHAMRIVDAMAIISKKHQVHAGVKLQYRDLNTLVHPAYVNNRNVPHIPRFLSTRLRPDEFQKIVQFIKSTGLKAIVTPFDEPSVDVCQQHEVDMLKVASCSAMDWPLLEKIAAANLPVIVSTGGLDIHDIDKIVSFFKHRRCSFALLHCIGLYPAPNETLNLSFILRMQKRYPGIPIGYSGHEAPDNLDPCLIAAGMDAEIFERHVGLPTESIPLNAYSSNPSQASAWVEAVMRSRSILGDRDSKPIQKSEMQSLQSLKRGVYAAYALPAGTEIEQEDVFYAMPCMDNQLTSGEFGQYRTRFVASTSYESGAPINESPQADPIANIRNIIHDARGFLYEAGIEPGHDVQIELSHHDGIENFRQTGAVLITVINRAYCKKLIIVFPGQKHPFHAHTCKEETFQLLWGDLDVNIENQPTKTLMPGDLMLVEVGVYHGFESRNGAIFEEISTTHSRTDSIYQDGRINQMDPMERKTVATNW